MGKASSAKKVQRAAKAAASSRGASERRELGFPLAVLAVVILGIGLVVGARANREPAAPPRIGDHWHSAYSIYDCGEEVSFWQSAADPDGIHSHGDSDCEHAGVRRVPRKVWRQGSMGQGARQ